MTVQPRSQNFFGACKLLAGKFMRDRCSMLASALSFSCLLSIVPFLAIVFAILKALNIHNTMTPVLLANIGVGSHEVVTNILRYIQNTNVGSLGIVGCITLIVSVLVTLDTVEDALNQICGIECGKAVHHKLRDYLIVIFCIPLLIAIAVTVATTLQHQGVVQWVLHATGAGKLMLLKLTPYLSTWIALICLYQFIPNVTIRFKYVLTGSIITGIILQMAQWGYIHFQLGVSRYNAIYGTLSLLPVFMVWIYTSWLIILAGMQLVWYLNIPSPSETIQEQ